MQSITDILQQPDLETRFLKACGWKCSFAPWVPQNYQYTIFKPGGERACQYEFATESEAWSSVKITPEMWPPYYSEVVNAGFKFVPYPNRDGMGIYFGETDEYIKGEPHVALARAVMACKVYLGQGG